MATPEDRRLTAILLKKNLAALYAQVMPIYALSQEWVVNTTNELLPSEGQVKAVLERYRALKIAGLSIDQSLRDIQTSEEIFSGPWPTYPPECGDMTTGLLIPEAGFRVPESGLTIYP